MPPQFDYDGLRRAREGLQEERASFISPRGPAGRVSRAFQYTVALFQACTCT